MGGIFISYRREDSGPYAGRRRLDNPNDYLRQEIAIALARPDVRVIPVLIGNVAMPGTADLPRPLAALTECNAVRITDESWDDQLARLIRALEQVVQRRQAAPRPPSVAAPRSQPQPWQPEGWQPQATKPPPRSARSRSAEVRDFVTSVSVPSPYGAIAGC